MEHGEAVEADLQRTYNVALSDVITGAMSWRRLGVLVAHLPSTSLAAQAAHGERWDLTDLLLANVADQLAIANWQRGGNKKAPRPKPLPRPGVKPSDEKRIGTESLSIDEWRSRYAARFEGGDHGCRARDRVRQHRSLGEGLPDRAEP